MFGTASNRFGGNVMKKYKVEISGLELWFMRYFSIYSGATIFWALIVDFFGAKDQRYFWVIILMGILSGLLIQKCTNPMWSKATTSGN